MYGADRAITSHMADLRRYARKLSAGRGDADELVQEALSRALSRGPSWDEIRDPRAYLMTILHNAYVDDVADRRRHQDMVATETDWPAPPSEPNQTDALALRDLRRALDQLPPGQRATVMLIGWDGLSYREAAERLHVPVGTVMSRLSRGRQALRRLVDG